MSDQSLGCAHRGRVCACVHIGECMLVYVSDWDIGMVYDILHHGGARYQACPFLQK
jgi:hypothetical protein